MRAGRCVVVALVAVAGCGSAGRGDRLPSEPANFTLGPWLRAWLDDRQTTLTVVYGDQTCYRAEHRLSVSEEGEQIVVRLEWRRLEEPPETCLAYGRLVAEDIALPRRAEPEEIVDAWCPSENVRPPLALPTTLQPIVSLPPLEPTTPSTLPHDCHWREVEIGPVDSPYPSATSTFVTSTLPPLEEFDDGRFHLATLQRPTSLVGRNADLVPAAAPEGIVVAEEIKAEAVNLDSPAIDVFLADYVDHDIPGRSRLVWIVIAHNVPDPTDVPVPPTSLPKLVSRVLLYEAATGNLVVMYDTSGEVLTDPTALV